MSKKITIPVSISWEDGSLTRPDGSPIVFPEKCVYCTGPKETTNKGLRTRVRKQVKGEWLTVVFKPLVPYCRRHSRQSCLHQVILAWFFGWFFVFGMAAINSLLKDVGGWSQTCVGLVGWLIGGFLIAFLGTAIAKLALSPVFKSLRDQSISGAMTGDGALGFSFAVQKHSTPDQPETYTFDATFANEEYAAEFEQLNTL